MGLLSYSRLSEKLNYVFYCKRLENIFKGLWSKISCATFYYKIFINGNMDLITLEIEFVIIFFIFLLKKNITNFIVKIVKFEVMF